MPMPMIETLATHCVRDDVLVADLGRGLADRLERAVELGRLTVKVKSVRRPSSETFCTIMSTLMPASAKRPEDRCRDARLIGNRSEA